MRIINRVLLISCILLGFFITSIYADSIQPSFNIDLQCSVFFRGSDNIKPSTISKTISLTNIKHKSGGTVLVSESDRFEFWAMIHGVQTTNNQRFVNNFQVAIKDKKNGDFMHALSDSVYTPGSTPKHARISLIDYYPDSFLEKERLFFECRSQ